MLGPVAVLLLGLMGAGGCRPAREASPQALPWPALARDPLENGRDLDRWPGWRGPNSSGIARGGSPPVEFSPAQACRWKVSVPGQGNSSPVVWDDKVLLTTARAETNPPALSVLCFRRSDGKLLWQSRAGQARGRTHNKNGYASASVATDGRRVVAFFGSAGLFCYDLSGRPLWRKDLGDLDHVWGTAASPVLYGNLVIQLCDCEKNSYLAAFDVQSGREAWRTPRESHACWTTPVVVDAKVNGGTRDELVVNGGGPSGEGLVIAYDPVTGHEWWRVRGTTDLVIPTTLAGGGLVFCASGRNGPILAIRPGGSGDVTASRVPWRLNRGGPYIPSGVLYRNRAYFVGDAGVLACYNAGDGQTLWTGRLRGTFSASLVAADGRIYATSEQGTVYVVAAADQFRLLAANDLGERCLATPAIAGGEMFIRTQSALCCFAADSGQQPAAPGPWPLAPRPSPLAPHPSPLAPGPSPLAPNPSTLDQWPLYRGDAQARGVARGELPQKLDLLWTFSDEKADFSTTAVIVDGTVLAASLTGKLYAVDLQSGKKKWEFFSKLGFSAPAAVRQGKVYVGDADGRFHCLDAATGRPLWHFDAGAEIDNSANFYADRVLFGSQDGYLYCLNAETGQLVWKYESPDQIRCCPTVVEDRAFVAGCDGNLHIIDLREGKSTAEVSLEGPTGCTPAVLGDTVFVGTEGNGFFAVDWKQAKVRWHYAPSDPPDSIRSSAAVTPQAVVVGSRDKLVHALDPGSGRPLWTFTTRGMVDSSPVIAGSRALVGSADGRVYALDLKTGQPVWQFEAGGSVSASPAVAGGRMVIGTDNGDLYCFGEKAGQ